jgi:hypothetical protein
MLSQWLVNELFQTSDYTNASYSNSQALANYYTLPEQYLWAKIAVAVGAPRSESDYISLPKNYVWKDIYDAVSGSSNGTIDWGEKQAVGHIAAAYRGDAGNPANLATYIDWPWRYQVAAISVATSKDRPSFIRDFAGLKTLNHGVGPTINFTRNTNATYFDSNGILQLASENQPRFDHGPLIITVSGLSDTQYNGEYTYSGEVTGYPYYLKAGVAEIGAGQGVASGIWRLEDLNNGDHFIVDGFENEAAFPWLVAAWENQGINPAGVTISQPNDNSKGLLIEESRTNLLERSAEFNDAYWNKLNATVTANDTVAPDGTATADAVFETVDNGFHAVSRGAVVPSTGTVTMSVFAKANGRSRFGIQVGAIYGDFDLSAVTASVPFGGISASIEPISNGWYRCAFTIAATADDAYILVFLDGASNSYAGDTTKGMYFWGAQAELGAFATSYIPTTGGTATRAADSAIVTPISSFYNQSEGTLFAEWNLPNLLDGGGPCATALTNSDDTDRIVIQVRSSGGATRHLAFISGSAVVTDLDFSSTVAGISKSAIAFAASNYAATRNGVTALTNSHAAVPTTTHLRVGAGTVGGSNPMNGHIRKVAYWPKRLSNALLQDITT